LTQYFITVKLASMGMSGSKHIS